MQPNTHVALMGMYVQARTKRVARDVQRQFWAPWFASFHHYLAALCALVNNYLGS